MQVEIKNNKIRVPLKGKDVWVALVPEEEIRQKYICRLVNAYGFTTKQMAQDYDYSKLTKEKIKSDILVWKNEKSLKDKEKPLIFIECKADSIIIRPEDYFKGIEISKIIGAEFFVATNSKQTKIYSKVFKITGKGKPNELINIPTYEQAQDDKTVSVLLEQTNEFAREEFSKTLTRCHNIIRNNDKLSPEAAFDEISKVLFVKTLYERSNNDGNIFSKKIYSDLKQNFINKNSPFYQELFENVKKELIDDDLFEQNEIIRIRENSFEAIVEELQIYNLSTTSDDVKGIAFEQFLGKTFRGELGQFFTPRTIVDFIVDVLDPQESEIICDPCCGSGGFLIKAFEYIRAKIENEIHLAKEKIKFDYYNEAYEKLGDKKKAEVDEIVNDLFSKLNAELDINNPKSRIRELSYDCIFGTDANPRMSRTAKMNMIMHGDGHGGVHHNDGLLNVNGIFENRFDIILTNPPFGSRVEKSLKITEADKYTDVERIKKYKKRYDLEGNAAYTNALKQVSDNIGKSLLYLYETGSMSTLTEVLFIERCLNLLKPGGRMGIVLPEGVLNNTNLQKIRDFVESRAKILLITSIPQDVFIASGATVKPSLLFFKKFTEEEAKEWKEIADKVKKDIDGKYKSIEQKELEIYKAFELDYEAKRKKLKSINTLKGVKKGNIKIDKAEYDKSQQSVETLKVNFKEAKTAYNNEMKRIRSLKESEIKAQIKKDFNYQIPIAEVEKAGISTTGAQIENELEPLAKEFKEYRKKNKLWTSYTKEINYQIADEEIGRVRIVDGVVSEPEVFYNKSKY